MHTVHMWRGGGMVGLTGNRVCMHGLFLGRT